MRVLSSVLTTLLAVPRRSVLNAAAAGLLAGSSNVAMAAADGEVSDLPKTGGIMKFCGEEVMSKKAHGTSMEPVQQNLRWSVDRDTAGELPRGLSPLRRSATVAH
jgi:hypothetical protein